MQITTESPTDIERISHIHYAAFKGHPMHKPGAEPVEHRIVERLRAANALSLSLLAMVEQQAVGHLALSPATIGACASGWYLLGPIGVAPEHQGKGIGSALMREAIPRMRNMGASGIVLVGNPEFYKRFSFINLQEIYYKGVPDQFVLALHFRDAAPRGEIIAHAAFNAPNSQ